MTIDDEEDEYARAAKFKVTKEILDEQEKIDRERLIKEMYIPPPLEILTRKFVNNEPVRTGFNQGLIPISIKNNYEVGREAQGPYIIVTSSQAPRRRDRDTRSTEPASRGGKRAVSRDSSIS